MNTQDIPEILVVEDNPHDLELTLRSLRSVDHAHRICIARDGEEALDFLFCEGPHADRDPRDPPKLILLDLSLPKVDGLEVLQRIKDDERTNGIPVVMLTSSKEQCDIMRSYRLGVNSYVVKPVGFEAYAAAVRQLELYWIGLNQSLSLET